jgi:hypothetical protein
MGDCNSKVSAKDSVATDENAGSLLVDAKAAQITCAAVFAGKESRTG